MKQTRNKIMKCPRPKCELDHGPKCLINTVSTHQLRNVTTCTSYFKLILCVIEIELLSQHPVMQFKLCPQSVTLTLYRGGCFTNPAHSINVLSISKFSLKTKIVYFGSQIFHLDHQLCQTGLLISMNKGSITLNEEILGKSV